MDKILETCMQSDSDDYFNDSEADACYVLPENESSSSGESESKNPKMRRKYGSTKMRVHQKDTPNLQRYLHLLFMGLLKYCLDDSPRVLYRMLLMEELIFTLVAETNHYASKVSLYRLFLDAPFWQIGMTYQGWSVGISGNCNMDGVKPQASSKGLLE